MHTQTHTHTHAVNAGVLVGIGAQGAPIFAFAILASAVRGDGARFADESTAFLRGARSSGSLIADEATTFLRGARSSGSLIADEEAPLVLPPRLAGRRHSRRNGVCGWQQRDSRRATKLLVFTCLVGTVCWWNVASRPLPPPSEAAAFGDVLATAARRALGGGLSGAAAGVQDERTQRLAPVFEELLDEKDKDAVTLALAINDKLLNVDEYRTQQRDFVLRVEKEETLFSFSSTSGERHLPSCLSPDPHKPIDLDAFLSSSTFMSGRWAKIFDIQALVASKNLPCP